MSDTDISTDGTAPPDEYDSWIDLLTSAPDMKAADMKRELSDESGEFDREAAERMIDEMAKLWRGVAADVAGFKKRVQDHEVEHSTLKTDNYDLKMRVAVPLADHMGIEPASVVDKFSTAEMVEEFDQLPNRRKAAALDGDVLTRFGGSGVSGVNADGEEKAAMTPPNGDSGADAAGSEDYDSMDAGTLRAKRRVLDGRVSADRIEAIDKALDRKE